MQGDAALPGVIAPAAAPKTTAGEFAKNAGVQVGTKLGGSGGP